MNIDTECLRICIENGNCYYVNNNTDVLSHGQIKPFGDVKWIIKNFEIIRNYILVTIYYDRSNDGFYSIDNCHYCTRTIRAVYISDYISMSRKLKLEQLMSKI